MKHSLIVSSSQSNSNNRLSFQANNGPPSIVNNKTQPFKASKKSNTGAQTKSFSQNQQQYNHSNSNSSSKQNLYLNAYNQYAQIVNQNYTPDNYLPQDKQCKVNQEEQNIKKKTIEGQQHSQSTRVSPNRMSFAPHQSSSNALVCQQPQMHTAYRQSTARMDQNSHSQFNLRIPKQVLGEQKNKIVEENMSIDYNNQSNVNIGGMSQSFINLIYPSKSKKLINNEQKGKDASFYPQQQQYQQQHQFLKENAHHQKSKSLIVCDQNNFQQQKPNQTVQKVQSNTYKKQSSVFNYSQRLKQLLQETGEETSKKHHQIFSQQPSPTQLKHNLLQGSIENQIQKSLEKATYQQQKQVQHTFDKAQSQEQQYLTLCDPKQYVPQTISYTIDYHQHKNTGKAQTSQSTPCNGNPKGHYDNAKLMQQTKQSQTRKPNQPLKNNFVIDIGNQNQQQQYVQQQQQLVQARQSQNDESKERNKRDASQEMKERFYDRTDISTRYEKELPQREKKQHQPTQSKILQNKQHQSIEHKRSISDYSAELHLNQQKLKKYINSNSNGDINGKDIGQHDSTMNVTPTSKDVDRASSFLQQYSYNYLEAHMQSVNNQNNKGGFYNQNKMQELQNPSFENSRSQNIFPNDKSNNQEMHLELTQNQISSRQMEKDAVHNVYQKRKSSFQHPNVATMHAKRSPCKSSFVLKENYQKQSEQRKKSIKPTVYNHQSSVNMQSQYQQFNHSLTNKQNLSNSIPSKMIKSEKVSPRKQILKMTLQKHHQQQPKKNVINVSIDLYKGTSHNRPTNVSSHYQQTLQPPPQTQYKQQTNNNSLSKSSSKQNISKLTQSNISIPNVGIHNTSITATHNNINNFSYGGLGAKSLQNSAIKRKDSFVAQSQQLQLQQQQMNFGKDKSPLRDERPSMMLGHNRQSSIQHQNSTQQYHQQQQQHVMGYSVQNSPSKNLAITQRHSSIKISNNSKSNSHAHTNIHSQSAVTLSPSNRCNSFANIHPSQQQHNFMKKDQEVFTNSNKHSFTNIEKKYNNIAQSKKNIQPMANQYYKRTDEAVAKKGGVSQCYFDTVDLTDQTQGVSETERLLNQIRNNVIKQKPQYQLVHPPSKLKSNEIMNDIDQFLNDKQNHHDLCKITEASLEQNHIETSENYKINKFQNIPKLNEMLDYSNQYMTTDPNLSPYSKDLLKLKKKIKFNFQKYNDAPTTTSEFYRIGRILGRGAFGKVNLAAHKISEQLVAIKSINKEFLKSEEDQKKKIMQEVGILKQSNHPSVVRLYDSFETTKHICFVMELCSGGDLLTYVRKRRKLKEDVAKYFFRQIIDGLSYLHHSKLIVHRDIKLDNILLDANGRIKICDFGVSKQAQSETERMTEQCGTPAYIAPEILRDKGYEGFKVDVWSAGVCLYAMLVGTVPFKAASMNELHHMILSGKYELKEQEGVSEAAKDLIAKLLQVDPKKRLSSYEVLGHPWLKDTCESMDIFTQKEKDLIQKEYLSKNIERNNNKQQIQILETNQQQDTDVLFTEHNLDTKTNCNSLLKNASTKSIILAPFNSTVSDFDEDDQEGKLYEWPSEVKKLMVNKKIIRFAPKVKDLDRQYEQNNNADLDNGVYNQFINDQEKEEEALNQKQKKGKDEDNKSLEDNSSQDSLKKSFRETELSSDDEKAEKQMEEEHQKQIDQKGELVEFEKQIKLKVTYQQILQSPQYVKYQEPAHEIDNDAINQIVVLGLYPKEYIIQALNSKEMNYATATYNLYLKKRQLLQTLINPPV